MQTPGDGRRPTPGALISPAMIDVAAAALAAFVYPITQVLFLSVTGLVLLHRKHVRSAFVLLAAATGWLYLCSTAMFANALMANLEGHFVPRSLQATETAEVIVLLGGAMRGDVHMGTLPDMNQQADRLVNAVSLYRAGKAPLLLLTGGAHPEYRPEAQQMQDLLQVMGVPPQAMLLETRSRTTYDNARFTAELLQARDVQRIILVTSGFHMRRAVAVFRAQGLDVAAAPTDFQRMVDVDGGLGLSPAVRNLNRTTLAFHELVGYQVYRLRGWF